MGQSASRPKPRPSAIGIGRRESLGVVLSTRERDPAIAAEVLAQLDADPEMKREHLALYLSAASHCVSSRHAMLATSASASSCDG